MTNEESDRPTSPIVARRWLGKELERLRKAVDHRQKDAATALGCSVGRVSYIESGDRPPSVDELQHVLLPLYKVPEVDRPRYLAVAATADQRGWWDDWDEASLPVKLRRCIGYEDGARRIRSFQSSVIPGLLQTPDYTRAVMRSLVTKAEVDITRQIDLRRRRQEILRHEGRLLDAQFVLHEGALRTEIGGAETLRAQLRHIAELAERRPNVNVRVVPFTAGGHGGLVGPFTIMNFDLEGDPGLVYLETYTRLDFLESPHDVQVYSEAFDRLVELALTTEESVQLTRSLMTPDSE